MAHVGISLPGDSQTNFLMLVRLIHFLSGITCIGLLYFFNLVSVPVLNELDQPTRSTIVPPLMERALWWFRWSALVTVLSGLAYWGDTVASAARNGKAHRCRVQGTRTTTASTIQRNPGLLTERWRLERALSR